MNGKIETCAASIWHRARLYADCAPSLRIPVTPGNRGLLRKLRAIEMAAWQKPAAGTPPGHLPGQPGHSPNPGPTEQPII